jgi:hypothetical protein
LRASAITGRDDGAGFSPLDVALVAKTNLLNPLTAFWGSPTVERYTAFAYHGSPIP